MPKHPSGALLSVLDLDRGSRVSLFRQLDDHLRRTILCGQLKPGMRLPSSRVLAKDLGVSRPTVINAFEQLVAEGFLEARTGSGTFIAAKLPEDLPFTPTPSNDSVEAERRQNPRLSDRGMRLAAAKSFIIPPKTHAFAANQPAYDEFPFAKWSRLWSRHWRRPSGGVLNYGSPLGYMPLRREIASYVSDARGVRCEPEQVIIVSSSHMAVGLTAMLLLDPGDKVWAEDPGYIGVRELLTAHGARIISVPVDDDGLDVETGVKMAPDARMVFVTPARQYPLGKMLSLSRRLKLLDWAQRNDAWLIEDDYDSEFRFKGRPLAAMHGLDGFDRVIYVGTFSKVLFPSLRIGYLVVPAALVEAYGAACQLAAKAVPTLPQAVLADFMYEGHFTAHIRRMRSVYQERCDAMLDASREHLAGLLDVRPADAGMNIVGWFPPGTDDVSAQRYTEAEGIVTFPMSYYFTETRPRPGLHLGFCNTPAAEMKRRVRTLARALESFSS